MPCPRSVSSSRRCYNNTRNHNCHLRRVISSSTSFVVLVLSKSKMKVSGTSMEGYKKRSTGRTLVRQRTRLYIVWRCVTMLLCWHDWPRPDIYDLFAFVFPSTVVVLSAVFVYSWSKFEALLSPNLNYPCRHCYLGMLSIIFSPLFYLLCLRCYGHLGIYGEEIESLLSPSLMYIHMRRF